MRLPFAAFAALALFVTAGMAVTVREQAAVWRAAGGPAFLPARWLDARGRATLWVFMRTGCSHCVDHVQALEHALAAYPESTQTRLRSQMVFVPARNAPAGVRTLADSVRLAFGIRITPTTWWVDGNGAVRRAWRGARGADAWTMALEFLAASAAGAGMP